MSIASSTFRLFRRLPGGQIVLRLLFCCDIPKEASIHESVVFNHNALGVVIHPNVVIEENVHIEHHVCLGQRTGDNDAAPRICKDCVIGAHAILLGGITVGEGSVVGAGSLVVKDIPPHSVFINKRIDCMWPNTKEKGTY